MIFKNPELGGADRKVIDEIAKARRNLGYALSTPRRWIGLVRRSTIGRAIRGSNSIEGYRVSLEDVVAAAQGEVVHANEETQRAVEGYRRAMTYALQLAKDPHFQWSEQVIKGLHFMMVEHDLDKGPGLWRSGAIFVVDHDQGKTVYEGPDFSLVPGLIGELVNGLDSADERTPDVVRAAMAHLNLAMIHPFRGGNGRMARCLQTLVLGRGGILEPPFSSIEEYLGANHQGYYDALAAVGKGGWHAENDPQPFLRFCLRAHYHQAHTLLRRLREAGLLWEALEAEVVRRNLHERTVLALFDAALGFRVVNATYRAAAEISQPSASRDLVSLVNAGLLTATGEKRARGYAASPVIVELMGRVASDPTIADPYQGELVLSG